VCLTCYESINTFEVKPILQPISRSRREEQRESADAFAASGRSTCQTEQSPWIGPNHRSTEGTVCTRIANSSTRFARIYVIYTRTSFTYVRHTTSPLRTSLSNLNIFDSTGRPRHVMAFEFANAAPIGRCLETIGGRMRGGES